MDLNKIDLPASVIADLYRYSLVEVPMTGAKEQPVLVKEVMTPLPEVAPTTESKWLGENKKNILIIVNHTGMVHLPDNELTLLTGMLTACRLSLADTAIVNLANRTGSSYKELVGQFKSKIILLFDVEPAAFGLPMNFPHFQLQPFNNSTFLSSPSLKELEADKLLKSKLWVCLKRLFNL